MEVEAGVERQVVERRTNGCGCKEMEGYHGNYLLVSSHKASRPRRCGGKGIGGCRCSGSDFWDLYVYEYDTHVAYNTLLFFCTLPRSET